MCVCVCVCVCVFVCSCAGAGWHWLLETSVSRTLLMLGGTAVRFRPSSDVQCQGSLLEAHILCVQKLDSMSVQGLATVEGLRPF